MKSGFTTLRGAMHEKYNEIMMDLKFPRPLRLRFEGSQCDNDRRCNLRQSCND